MYIIVLLTIRYHNLFLKFSILAIGVLKAEIQELNFGMKKIFKLLKEHDITESSSSEFSKTFPIRTQNEMHAIEVKAIANNDYAERLVSLYILYEFISVMYLYRN